MKQFFLKMQPLHLFALTVGFPTVLFFLLTIVGTVNQNMRLIQIASPLAALSSLLGLSFWMYSAGTGLYRFLPEGVRVHMGLYKLSTLAPAIGIGGFLLFILFNPPFPGEVGNVPSLEWLNGMSFAIFTLLTLAGVLVLFYSMASTAKIIKAAYSETKFKTESFTVEFFMMILFPIGVWFLQQKVNRVYQQRILAQA